MNHKHCAGFDEDGRAFDCPNPPGTPWTPVWCSDCDGRRRTRLTQQFEALASTMNEFVSGDSAPLGTAAAPVAPTPGAAATP